MKQRITNKFLFGYMPSFDQDLISEINFAKDNFDFIEITLKQDLKEYPKHYLSKIKKALDNFQVLGHLHWETDLRNEKQLKNILQNYKLLGIENITVHPQENANWDLLINLCKKNKISLSVENGTDPPFNTITAFKKLFQQYKDMGMTLDIGHCLSIKQGEYKQYLECFHDRIKHVHLHNSKGLHYDHLPFDNKKDLNDIMKDLNLYWNKRTITLEIFKDYHNKAIDKLTDKKRKTILLRHLKWLV